MIRNDFCSFLFCEKEKEHRVPCASKKSTKQIKSPLSRTFLYFPITSAQAGLSMIVFAMTCLPIAFGCTLSPDTTYDDTFEM